MDTAKIMNFMVAYFCPLHSRRFMSTCNIIMFTHKIYNVAWYIQANQARTLDLGLLVDHSLVTIATCVHSVVCSMPGSRKKIFKEIMQFQYMTYMVTPQHKNPYPGGHEIYDFCNHLVHFLGYRYYKLCLISAQKFHMKIHQFYTFYPQIITPWDVGKEWGELLKGVLYNRLYK